MIELSNVSFSYGASSAATGDNGRGREGVRDLSLAVGPGRCVLLAGRSGCGKSTACRLANGLAPSFFPGRLEGQVLVDGENLAGMPSWEVARRVGSVFQNPRTQFFNVDSTAEVAFALESQGVPEEEVRRRTQDTIAELGISQLADRSIFSLSGGEKQRIAYASVWAARPRNLVLDEPTGNLDMAAIEDLRRYLALAKSEGVSILVAEHRLWWLMDLIDEVVYLKDGRAEKSFGAGEFRALDECEIASMGLRVRGLAHVRARREERPAARPGFSLVADGVCVVRGDQEVLHDVCLGLPAGEVCALIGRNGAGKSTLARTLVGLQKTSVGTTGRAPAGGNLVRRCAMVFQDVNYQLFAESVRAEVTFGLTGAEVPAGERVEVLLADLGLLDLAERHPHTLSGGQKQRLAVAACVAAQKDVVVLDEPTSGLDLAGCSQVAGLARELARGGRAVLVVTHDLEFIAQACERVVLLEQGRVCCDEPVAANLGHVGHMLRTGTA